VWKTPVFRDDHSEQQVEAMAKSIEQEIDDFVLNSIPEQPSGCAECCSHPDCKRKYQ
jgi:hypothetical protein